MCGNTHKETNDDRVVRFVAYEEIEINAVVGKHGGRLGKINERDEEGKKQQKVEEGEQEEKEEAAKGEKERGREERLPTSSAA